MNTTPRRFRSRYVSACLALLAFLALALAPAPGAAGVLPNVLVNNPALDTTDRDTQLDSTLVLGAHNSIIAAYLDSGSWDNVAGGANDHFIGLSRSLNGGVTWEDLGPLPDTVRGDGMNPVLARGFGVGGLADTIYLATTDFDTGTGPSAIQVYTFFDNGLPFLPNAMGVITATAGAPGDRIERPWITVDNFVDPPLPLLPKGQGNVYLVWRRQNAAGTAILFSKSVDNGNSFSPPVPIATSVAGNVNAPVVAVGPFPSAVAGSHPVYVFWLEQAAAGAPNLIRMRRSTDQGAMFDPVITVVTMNNTAFDGDLRLQSGFRGNSFPRVAVNPNVLAGNNTGLYVAYNDDPAGADRADVFLLQSQNSGAAWAPVGPGVGGRVNDDTGPAALNDQFNPTLAITPNGSSLFVGFYDRRRDPRNINIDAFGRIASISPAGVASFIPAGVFSPPGLATFRITTESFPPVTDQDPAVGRGTLDNTYMGSSDGAVADNTSFSYTWGDHRLSNPVSGSPLIHQNQPDVRFASVPVAGPRGILDLHTEGASGGIALSGGNGNAFIDFNECNNLVVTLINRGNSNAVGVSATLVSLTPGVVVSQSASVYPDIAAGATAASTMPFSVSTSPGFVCGTVIDLVLNVETAEAGSFVIPIRLNTGTAGDAIAYESLDTLPNPIPIPDNDGTRESVILVSGLATPISSVKVRMHILHSYRSDLDVWLEAPDGSTVVLTSDNGSSLDNYGASCVAPIIFDDAAATEITMAPLVNNLAGSFRPEQPLAALMGKSGNGFWKLRVRDDAAADIGTIQCWGLDIATATCTDGGGPCLRFLAAQVAGGNGNGRLDINECADINVVLTNSQAVPYLGVSARLISLTPEVTVLAPNSAYPDIPAAGVLPPLTPLGTNLTPFRVSIPSSFACGRFVEFVLRVTAQSDGTFDVPFRLQVGSCAPNPPYVAVSPAVPRDIPDLATIQSTILIPPGTITAPIGKVTVSVGITHSYVGDLHLRLIAPDNTFADLVLTDNGRPGVDYGTFTTLTPPFTCLVPTTFDDDAAISIRAGAAPYAGAFVPTGPTGVLPAVPVTPQGRGPLSIFTGKSGPAVNGTWTLQVVDGLASDVGQLVCWSLSICEPEQYVPLTGTLPSKIPDNDGYTDIEIPVDGITEPIHKVRLAVRIAHPVAPELDLWLISPDGTAVSLSSDNGVVGGVTLPNYGLGSANPTVFDDDSATSITVGNTILGSFAVGQFRPEEPLAAFAGKTGAAVNGIWRLRVMDDTPGNTPPFATVTIAQLQIFTATCTDGGGACAPNRELVVASENPPGGVPITVSLTDRNGDRDGTTLFTRTYGNGTSVDLTAPLVAPNGNTFVAWRVDGVLQAAGQVTVTLTLNAARNATALYAGPRLLTVQSRDATAVPIVVNPPPDGVTPFSRPYVNLTSVTLTAPAVAPNGYVFLRWRVDGVSRGVGINPISVVMDSAHIAVAEYESPTRTLKVQSEEPDSGVVINVTPDFLGRGAGTTTFYREYLTGGTVTLEAPAVLPNGRLFKRWEVDDHDFPRGQRTITLTMDRFHEAEAHYQSATVELEVESEDPDRGVSVQVTPDIHGRSAGVTTFEREYNRNSVVTLIAPPVAGNRVFKRWEVDDDDLPRGQRIITLLMDEDIEAEAEYEDEDDALGDTSLALWFDGFNDQVRVPDSPSLRITGRLTVEAWIQRDVAGVAQTIVEKSGCPGEFPQVGGYALRVLATDQLRFETKDSCTVVRSVTGTISLQPGVWYHVAGVWDGAQLRVYVNGVADGTAASAIGPAAGTSPFLIGASGNAVPASPFAGFIDEVRVWSLARSQADLAANSGTCLTGTEPGLAAYWRFNEEDSLVAHDSTPNLNNGLLLNGPLWADSTVGCTSLPSPAPFVGPRPAPVPAPAALRLTLSDDMAGHACQLSISSPTGAVVVVEVSADLVNWAPLACIKNDTGECQVIDPMNPDASRRFFRLRQEP